MSNRGTLRVARLPLSLPLLVLRERAGVRAFACFLCALAIATNIRAAEPTTLPATTRPSLDPLPGWSVKIDGLADRPPIRTSLAMPVPTNSSSYIHYPNRPGAAVMIYEWGGNASYECWDMSTSKRKGRLLGRLNLENPAISPDGTYLAGSVREGGRESAVDIYTFDPQKRVQRLSTDAKAFRGAQVIGFVGNDKIATISERTVEVWEINTGKKVASFDLWFNAEPKHMALSPNGNYLAMAGDRLMIYDLRTGELAGQTKIDDPQQNQRNMYRAEQMAEGVAFSLDGRDVAAVFRRMNEYRLIVWDVASGQILSDSTAEARENHFYKGAMLEWSPDGNFLVLWGTAFLDRETGKPIFEAEEVQGGHQEPVRMADAWHIIVPFRDSNRGVMFQSVALPKAQMEKVMKIVRAGGQIGDEKLPPLKKPDLSAMQDFVPLMPNKPFAPDPAIPRKLPGTATWLKASPPGGLPAGPGGRRPNFSPPDLKGPFFSAPATAQAAVMLGLRMPNSFRWGYFKSWVERYDLAANRLVDVTEIAPISTLIDMSLDGKLLLLQSGDSRLDVIAPGGVGKPIAGWRPYEADPDRNSHKVSWAAIIDSAHVLTLNTRGELVSWEIPACKAIYRLKVSQHQHPALSPNRKQIAATVENGIGVFDTSVGETLVLLEEKNAMLDLPMSFCPEGDLLAVAAGDQGLKIWDLRTGKTANEIGLPKQIAFARPIQWVGPHHLMLAREYLLDLQLRSVVWRYYQQNFFDIESPLPDDRLWYLAPAEAPRPPCIVATALPHAQAQALAASFKPEDLLLIKPGMQVSLNVSITGNEADRKRVVDALTNVLKANGLEVVDGQNVQLSATVTATNSRTEMYRPMFGRGEQQAVTISDMESKLEFIVNGRPVWQIKVPIRGYTPSMITPREGQSAQDAAQEQQTNMTLGLFLNPRIPKYITKPLEEINIGYSRLTAAGPIPDVAPKPAPPPPPPQY